jgi:hypothetical protein
MNMPTHLLLKKGPIPMLALCCMLAMAPAANAQSTKPAGKTEALKPVVFLVKFGPYKNNMPIVLTDLKRALNTELKVTDSVTGQAYEVISFRFGWRKKEPSDDYKTGKKKIITSFNAVDVYNKTAKSTDELIFEAIYVQHPVSKKMYQVPALSFKLI